jgi:hypothetical protein
VEEVTVLSAKRRQWDREARELPIVFIVGAGGSGTSLLYRSLQAHPSFKTWVGPHVIESHAVARLSQLQTPADVARLEDSGRSSMANYLMGFEGLNAVITDVADLARRRRVVRSIAGRYRDRPALWRAAGEHHVVRRYFLEALQRRGVSRVVEKTPSNIGWSRHIQLAFPKAQMIYIVRHPIDVVTSFRRKYQDNPNHPGWANISVDQFCPRWAHETKSAVEADRRNARFLLVRYEDFTSNTEQTVRLILDFLGEPFVEDCLLAEPDTSTTIARPWQPNLFEPVQTTTKNWTDYMDEETARQVEDRLADAMALVGYERRTG